jgi:Flp pilus assembly protein TadD
MSERTSGSGVEPLRALRSQAAALMNIGRYDAAIPLLSRAAAMEPDNPEIKCDLSLALMNTGRLQDADAMAKLTIASAPDYELGYRVRSIILCEAGRAKDAVALAKEAVRLDPPNPFANSVLAQAHLAAKENRQAWAAAQRVVELSPERSSSHNLVGLAAIGTKRWREAEQACREALRLDPTNWAPMNNLGVVLQAQGRRAEAVQAYERAAQMNPASRMARNNLVQAVGVQAVGPVNPAGAVTDPVGTLILLIFSPWLIPLVLIEWLVGWLRSRSIRSKLSPGANEYYGTQTLAGAVDRMPARDVGIFAGFTSFFGFLVVEFVILGLAHTASPNLNSGIRGLLACFSVAVGLAAATGILVARHHSRKRD